MNVASSRLADLFFLVPLFLPATCRVVIDLRELVVASSRPATSCRPTGAPFLRRRRGSLHHSGGRHHLRTLYVAIASRPLAQLSNSTLAFHSLSPLSSQIKSSKSSAKARLAKLLPPKTARAGGCMPSRSSGLYRSTGTRARLRSACSTSSSGATQRTSSELGLLAYMRARKNSIDPPVLPSANVFT